MRAKTKEGERLKRLITSYVAKCLQCNNLHGGLNSHIYVEQKIASRDNAKKKLFDAIDELTSIDITPRAVQEGY